MLHSKLLKRILPLEVVALVVRHRLGFLNFQVLGDNWIIMVLINNLKQCCHL